MNTTPNTTDAADAIHRLALAARAVTAAFGDEELGHDVGQHMTCTEANLLADLMAATGDREAAARFLLGHSSEDDEGDSHHGWIGDGEAIGVEEQRERAREYVADLIG